MRALAGPQRLVVTDFEHKFESKHHAEVVEVHLVFNFCEARFYPPQIVSVRIVYRTL